MDDVAQRLRDAGLKVTPQRLTIYKMLLGTKSHPGADDVYRAVKEKLPGLSFNTVYTTLLSLEDRGLIQRLDVGQPKDRFDANTRSHVHLVCLECGRVADLGDDTPQCLIQLTATVNEKSGWEILSSAFTAYGYCPACRKGHP